jgi:molecular chaperone DnaK (HSP70)
VKLGIDLGTTRTIVSFVDRGNYPVVSFLDDDGDAHEHFPSVVASVGGGKLAYGFDALKAAKDGAPLLRSFKRALASADVNGADPVRVGDVEVRLNDLLVGFLRAVDEALRKRSNLSRRKWGEGVEAVIAVPAHAHGAQRFLTLDAFRRAGFDVKAMINEPSAAGFEYTHRQGRTVSSKRTRVVVYDLGGGTFDASLVKVDGVHHDVLATAGLNKLGGDDFDACLLACALAAAKLDPARVVLDTIARANLLDQCREAKERITPQTKRVALEVPTERGLVEVSVGVEQFYDHASELVSKTVEAMKPLLAKLGDDADTIPDGTSQTDVDEALSEIAGIYLVGGGSGLPLVPRVLKETFGRRVHRSPHPASSTAIGLAIAADEEAGFALADRLSRSFGVFRESKAGRAVAFDPIFLPDTALPSSSTVVVSRRYRAAHNVGHFRFVECTSVDASGEPRGDLVPFAEVLFPFDPALRGKSDLRGVAVERCGVGPEIEERYVIDPHGLVEVHIADLETGYQQTHRIG